MKWRRFTLLIEEDVYADMRALARSCDGTVSGFVRDMIHRTLRQYYAFGGRISSDNPQGVVRSDVEV